MNQNFRISRSAFSAVPQRAWWGCLLLSVLSLTGCQTLDRKTFEEKYPFKAKYSPRWDQTNEIPYEETAAVDKFGRNIRDGLTGIGQNFVQALMSFVSISPYTGFGPGTGLMVQKLSTMGGDAFGLVDDNAYTRHVFLGFFSRQFLRFGSSAQRFTETLGGIQDTTFEGPKHTTMDYVGNETFHTKVYGRPSAVTALVGVLAVDLTVRPVGNFLVIFGAREKAKKVDKAGLDMIQKCLDVDFL